ncbi:MAG: hypothetical protein GY714_11975 [Desulfobacterales bacterium]|nr:hypothetical protein [Desulfobacterales bacterium]
MKHYLIKTVLFLLFVFLVQPLFGNTKRIKTSYYGPKNKLSHYEIVKKDKRGNVIIKASYSSKGEMSYKLIFDYNQQGQLVKKVHHTKKHGLYQYHQFQYDSTGNLIKTSHFNTKDELINFEKRLYNSNGDLIKTSHFNMKKKLIWYKKRLYNQKYNQKKLHKEEFRDTNNRLLSYFIYHYQTKEPVMTRIKYFYHHGKPFKSSVYAYNANGKMTYHQEYAPPEVRDGRWSEGYEYDSQGRIKAYFLMAYNEGEESHHYDYNMKGKLVRISVHELGSLRSKGKLMHYTRFEYDSKKNLIKRTIVKIDAQGNERDAHYTTYSYEK